MSLKPVMHWQGRLPRLEEAQALNAERTRIAGDPHDELDARLTALAMRADLAGQNDNRDNTKWRALAPTKRPTDERA